MSFYHKLRESSQSEELPFGKLPALSDFLSFILKGKGWSYSSGGDSGENYCSFTKQKGEKKVEVEAKILSDNQVLVIIWLFRIGENKYELHDASSEILGQPKIKVFTVKDDWKKEDYSWVVEQAEKVAESLNESVISQAELLAAAKVDRVGPAEAVNILASLVGGKLLHQKDRLGFTHHILVYNDSEYRFVTLRRRNKGLAVYRDDSTEEFYAVDSGLSEEDFLKQTKGFLKKIGVDKSLYESKIYPELNNIQLEKTSNDLPFEGKVFLKPSPTADTRSADDLVSKEELKKSTEMHISDVQKAATLLTSNLLTRVKNHDHTKLKYFEEYFKQFRDAQQTGQWSQDHEAWEKKYHLAERHHLKHRAPDDIDLLDVLEMICDCCVAAMARSGKYNDEPFDSLVLKKAYDNTIQKLLKVIEVKK